MKGPTGATRAAARDRLRLIVQAAVLMVTSWAGLLLGSALIFAIGMAWFVVLLPVLPVLVAIVRRFADAHRRWAAGLLGTPIPAPYRPLPDRRLLRRLRILAGDPASWRDLGWLLVNATAGFLLAGTVVSLAMSMLGFAALPFAWPFLPEEVPPRDGGPELRSLTGDWGLVVVTGWPSAALASLQAIPMAVLCWWATPRLLRWHARLTRALLAPTDSAVLSARVEQLAESRAEAVDSQAAELRRIERDLHDGAQARLVSLGMSLGLAEEMLADNPEAARDLLAEARESTGQALAELRDLVHGIHPPVLADRGLPGAVHAVALAHPGAVDVTVSLPGRLEAPVESAAYFAVAEALTNVARHAHAARAWVEIWYDDGVLKLAVGDDGHGGAQVHPGGGLHGLERRLAAFDGTLSITSPPGGPTVVTMELPCALSSPKTSPSSGTD